MQSKMTLHDYEIVINRYSSLARSHGCKVIPCGTIKNPGISDIDCILVADDWKTFRQSLKLLNPEAISSLFVHGPFVCTTDTLPALFRYTTLRPQYRDDFVYESFDYNQQLIVAARQAGSIIHFGKILSRSRSARSESLILKSMLYTFRDCSCFFNESSNHVAEVETYALKLDEMREMLILGILDEHKLNDLKTRAKKLHKSCKNAVLEWIMDSFSFDSLAEPDALVSFLNILNGDALIKSIRSDLVVEFESILNFRKEIEIGYVDYGLLWRGAEAPFHGFNVSSIGQMIWVRRFIKRAFSLSGRVFNGV
ncbi:MAG: hypothetical protein WEB02_08700 [Methylophaga sp.]